jgi:hypothetical protein
MRRWVQKRSVLGLSLRRRVGRHCCCVRMWVGFLECIYPGLYSKRGAGDVVGRDAISLHRIVESGSDREKVEGVLLR